MDQQYKVFDCLDKSLIEDALRRSEGNPELTIYNILFNPGCASGDNYMSEVIRATVYWNTKDKGTSKNIIIKRQIANSDRKVKFRCDVAFENEINAYNVILPALQRNCSHSLVYPKCLFADRDLNPNIIILEDLAELGYGMVDRTQGVDEAQTKLVLQELARLHASSITLKYNNLQEFLKIKKPINEIVFCEDGRIAFSSGIENSFTSAIKSLKTSNQNNRFDNAINSLENLCGTIFDKLVKKIEPKEPFSVICHGDIWVNNLLFNQTNFENYVTFLDLQGTRYCSPCIDINHFLFTSTVSSVRSNIMELLKYYHDSFLLYVFEYLNNKEFYQEVVAEFSFEWLTSEFKECLLYGLVIAFWVMPAITFDRNNVPNLDLVDFKPEEDNIDSYTTDTYHQRIKETIEEFVEKGWLPYL